MNTKIRSLLLTLPALFTIACGDLPPDAYEAELDQAELDADDEELAVDEILTTHQDSAAPLPGTVAQHPAFAQLSQRAYVRIGKVLTAKSLLTAPQLESSYAIFEACRDMSGQFCVDELAAADLNIPLTATEAQLRTALNTSFHLDQLSVPVRTTLLLQAQAAYIAADGVQPPLSLVPSTFEDGAVTCNAGCKASILSNMETAHAGMMARLVSTDPTESGDGEESSSGGGGGFVGILVEVAIAVGKLIVNCWLDPDCHMWPEGENDPECNDNGDCASNQYCWKGPLGMGVNECRNKKSNGTKCGNDDACASNCCNFNIAGSKCDVPSKCN